ncbi:DUF4349 domain-containing protein [Marinilabiliaceae bacterium JC017]|nr:DUF4349 domain-containing protein [Marinilabiliaceae bacterium JC017]
MKINPSVFITAFLLSICLSCTQTEKNTCSFGAYNQEEEIIPITRQEETTPPPPPLPEASSQPVIKKKIIKDGNLGLSVKQLTPAKQHVDSLMKRYSGYYGNENLQKSDYELTYELTIRIPAVYFETFISKLEVGVGEIQYKNIEARDVTTEFIDLETRLANKRSYLTRYKTLLKKANSVKDILAIEEEIRSIEEEIDSTEGRLKYLGDQVNYSTLHLNLSQEREYIYTPTKRDRFIERFKQSLSGGWHTFVSFVLFMIRLWPFIILIILAFLLRLQWRKKRKKAGTHQSLTNN